MDENLQINVWNHVKPNDKPTFIDVYSFLCLVFSTSRMAKKHLVNLVTGVVPYAKQTHGVIKNLLTTGIDRRWAWKSDNIISLMIFPAINYKPPFLVDETHLFFL